MSAPGLMPARDRRQPPGRPAVPASQRTLRPGITKYGAALRHPLINQWL